MILIFYNYFPLILNCVPFKRVRTAVIVIYVTLLVFEYITANILLGSRKTRKDSLVKSGKGLCAEHPTSFQKRVKSLNRCFPLLSTEDNTLYIVVVFPVARFVVKVCVSVFFSLVYEIREGREIVREGERKEWERERGLRRSSSNMQRNSIYPLPTCAINIRKSYNPRGNCVPVSYEIFPLPVKAIIKNFRK